MATTNMTINQRLFLLNDLVKSVVGALRAKYVKQVPSLFYVAKADANRGYYTDLRYDGETNPFKFWWEEINTFSQFSQERFVGVKATYSSVLKKEVCQSLETFAEDFAKERLSVPSREWFEQQIADENYTLEVTYEDCMTQPRTQVKWNGEAKQLKKERKAMARKFLTQRKKLVEVYSEARADVLAVNRILREAARDLALVDNHEARAMLTTLEEECLKVIK